MPAAENHSDILYPGFTPGVCDFCAMIGAGQPALVYTDPETQCLYCLPCLAGATDPANQLEETEREPDPALMAMAREIIALRITNEGEMNHARN